MQPDTLKILEKVSKNYWWPNKSQIQKILWQTNKSLEDIFFQKALGYYVSKYKKELRKALGKKKIKAEDYSEQIPSYEETVETRSFEQRDWQQMAIDFLNENQDNNCIISLTTWEWKTIVALNEMLKYLWKPWKVVFCAPTNELVKQQYQAFLEFLEINWYDKKSIEIWYMNSKDELESNPKIVFTTHHWLEKISSTTNDLWIIDEIHIWEEWNKESWTHNYPTFKNYEYQKEQWNQPRILWLTALSTNQEKIITSFDIQDWFVGSQEKNYKPRNYLLHSQAPQNSLESEEFRNLQEKLETARSYIIHNIDSFFKNLKTQWVKIPSDILETFQKNKLKSKSYINKTKQLQMQKLLKKRIRKKFSKEFYQHLIFKKLVYILDKLNNLKKNLETDDYTKTLKNVTDLIEEIDKEIIKFENKCEENQNYDSSKFYHNIKYSNFGLQLFSKLKHKYQLENFAKILAEYENSCNHPKLQQTLEISETNKKHGKTTMVYVEDKELIFRFMEIAKQKWFKVWYMVWWNKSKKQKIIQNFVSDQVKSWDIDIVFTTSVMKLWMNFDISELVLYNLPKNEKDLLQFVGRVGRYKAWANVHFVYPKDTIEYYQQFSRKKSAKRQLLDQFREWEKLKQTWDKLKSPQDFSSSVKKHQKQKMLKFDKPKKQTIWDYRIKQIKNWVVEEWEVVCGRFKIMKISNLEDSKLIMELSDSSTDQILFCEVSWFNSKNDKNRFKKRLNFQKNSDNIYVLSWKVKKWKIHININKQWSNCIKKLTEEDYDIDEFDPQLQLFR